MTLISSLITDAFRESNILALRKAPTTEQAAEALRLFQQNIRSIYGSEAGEDLADWPLGTYGREAGAYTVHPRVNHPPINSRLLISNTEAMTVYFPSCPQDGSRIATADLFFRLVDVPVTLDGNGRTIDYGLTVLLGPSDTFTEWFYNAEEGNWGKLTSLAATDHCPFPESFDAFFYIGLAMRLNPRYGRTMDDQTALVFKQQRRQFIARYLQSMPLQIDDSISWPFMTSPGRQFSSNAAFNRGWYGRP